MHKCTAKLSLLRLIILEASIYDEWVLSEGFCPEGDYVLMELCMEGVLSEGVLSEGVLSEGVFRPEGVLSYLPPLRPDTVYI